MLSNVIKCIFNKLILYTGVKLAGECVHRRELKNNTNPSRRAFAFKIPFRCTCSAREPWHRNHSAAISSEIRDSKVPATVFHLCMVHNSKKRTAVSVSGALDRVESNDRQSNAPHRMQSEDARGERGERGERGGCNRNRSSRTSKEKIGEEDREDEEDAVSVAATGIGLGVESHQAGRRPALPSRPPQPAGRTSLRR